MTDTTLSNCIFDYPDIVEVIIKCLTTSDIQYLRLTHSCFTHTTTRALFSQSTVDKDDLNEFSKSSVAKYVIDIKVEARTGSTLDLTEDDFWRCMPKLRSTEIFRWSRNKWDKVIVPYDLLAKLEWFTCSSVKILVLPDVLPATLKRLELFYCDFKSSQSLSSCRHSLTLIDCRLESPPVFHDSLTCLDVSYSSSLKIFNLPQSLSSLKCTNCAIDTFPYPLPQTLLHLDCSHNCLSSISNLPSSLKELVCDNNVLTSLPSLPGSLTWLSCAENQLAEFFSISGKLPSSLQALNCSNNELECVPPSIPASLLHLDCSFNKISSISHLPPYLKELNCSNCILNSLPPFPPSLVILACAFNKLSVLPSLPDSLQILDCEMNMLTTLPNLPFDLRQLNIIGSKIKNLTSLPKSLRRLSDTLNEWPDIPPGCEKADFTRYTWKYGYASRLY